VRLQHAENARVGHHAPAERLGHRRDGDVVVGGTDSTAGEYPLRLRPRPLERVDDDRDLVGNGLDPPHFDAEVAELAGEPGTVLVADLGGEDLVADDDDGRGGHSASPRSPSARASSMPYSRIFLMRVVRDTPRRAATRDLLPRSSRRPLAMRSRSTRPTAVARSQDDGGRGGEPAPFEREARSGRACERNSGGMTSASPARTTRRSSSVSRSTTFP